MRNHIFLPEPETQESLPESSDGHTPDNPYCSDLSCWCHTDVGYHDEVTHPGTTETEIAIAYQFLELTRR